MRVKVICKDTFRCTGITDGNVYHGVIIKERIALEKNDFGWADFRYPLDCFDVIDKDYVVGFTDWDYGLED